MRGWTKLALLTLACTGLAGHGWAQSVAAADALPSTWTADSRTGCKVWNPEPEPEESMRWSGGCQGGFASGPGVTEWRLNDLVIERTEASRTAGHLQGKGVQTFANGDRFEGSWKDDRKEGQGSYAASAGWTYTGEFKGDQFDGVGVMTDREGNRYEGGWKAGRRSGQGDYTGADGSHYSGLWVDGQPAGGPKSVL